jgi:hypothetical protein
MFTAEFFDYLFKVITSWQIIATTVVLIVYFSIVSYVARLYHPRPSGFSLASSSKPKKEKKEAVELPESGGDDDLGLEE